MNSRRGSIYNQSALLVAGSLRVLSAAVISLFTVENPIYLCAVLLTVHPWSLVRTTRKRVLSALVALPAGPFILRHVDAADVLNLLA